MKQTVECMECGKTVDLRLDGTLKAHRDWYGRWCVYPRRRSDTR